MEAGGEVRYEVQGGQALLTIDRPRGAQRALARRCCRSCWRALDARGGGPRGARGGAHRRRARRCSAPAETWARWPETAASSPGTRAAAPTARLLLRLPGPAQAHGGAGQRARARRRAGAGARVRPRGRGRARRAGHAGDRRGALPDDGDGAAAAAPGPQARAGAGAHRASGCPAREALALGLLNRVVPAAELDAAVARARGEARGQEPGGARARDAAPSSPRRICRCRPRWSCLASQLSLNVLAEDAAEGVTAFLEKRPPQWKDR